jgi:DNA-binding winged helix-turn-helix (wHTH) protein/Tol biopolymer transport system component
VAEPRTPPAIVRFGIFEVDLQARELRKNGSKLKLTGQPFQVLAILLERAGELVTREELQKRLWPDTFVDVDHNLNTAINKIREVLGDSAENPRFVETLSRRGYRFVAPVNGGVPVPKLPEAEVPFVEPTTQGRLLSYALATTMVLILLAVGAVAVWKTVRRTTAVPSVLGFTRLTDDGQTKFGPMATDGSRIYFNEELPGRRNIIAQVAVRGGEAVPLSVPLKGPMVEDLSREGTELLVGNPEGSKGFSFWVQPVAGGSPRRVGTILGERARFSPDGTSIIYGNGHDFYSVSRDGSSSRKLLAAHGHPFSLQFSPDARVFRFTQFDDQVDSMAIMEAAVDGTGLREISGGCCGEWTSDGRFFIFQNRSGGRLDLWVLPEKKNFAWQGDPKPIQLTAGPLNFTFPLLSKDGKEIFAIGVSHRAEVIRYDSGSGQFVPYLSGISAEGLAFSRDGQWVTYTTYPEGALWQSKVDGSDRLQLTFPPLRAFLPRWSPDGKQIAFSARVPGATWNAYWLPSEGGAAQQILPSEQSQMDVNWTPDGNSLVFASAVVPNAPIYIYDLRSKLVSTVPGSKGLYSPHLSPDGSKIAAITTELPHLLMLFDFATHKWTKAFGSGMGYENWSHDGQYLYFQDSGALHVPYRIVRLRLRDGEVENITDLKNVGRSTTGTIADWFGLAPDDSPLFSRDISTSEIYSLELHWP